jgi:colanic acid/amylovoran biosynthesis glycosyltransferase
MRASYESDRLLLVLPIRAFRSNHRVYIDKQACNGLRLWLHNFSNVLFVCPVVDEDPPSDRAPIDEIQPSACLKFVGLPEAYNPVQFLKALVPTARLLSTLIEHSDHLHFAIGGLWGDWGSVAAIIASRKKRPFSVWTDRVESKVAAFHAGSKIGFKKLYWQSTAALMRHYERFIIRLSSIGLFHGMDCFESYAPYSNNPHLVHDIHLNNEARVSVSELHHRYATSTETIRIVYAGRAHREKGIFDWIETLRLAHRLGTKFDAVWYGDGPDLETAINAANDLKDHVHFPGPISEHQELIAKLKQFDLFLFCHKTPESPRCLIEALICGLPILGYDSSYSRDLISENGGGRLTPPNQPDKLAKAVADFPARCRELTNSAIKDGADFNDEVVFRQRSDLMRLISRKNGTSSQDLS